MIKKYCIIGYLICSSLYAMDCERGGTLLHELVRPSIFLACSAEEIGKKQTLKLKRIKALAQFSVDIYARNAIGRTVLEFPYLQEAKIATFLQNFEKRHWNAFKELRRSEKSYISLLHENFILEIGKFLRPNPDLISINYILKNIDNPPPFDWCSPSQQQSVLEEVEQKFQKGVDLPVIKEFEERYFGPLLNAICTHYFAPTYLVPLLIAKGVHIRLAFTAAIYSNNVPIIKQLCSLLQTEEKIHMINEPLIYPNFLDRILSREDAPRLKPLFHAISEAQFYMVRLLLKEGALVNIKMNDTDQTPLHWAVCMGSWIPEAARQCNGEPKRLTMTRLLCDAGADLFAKDRRGDTPLLLARKVLNKSYSEESPPPGFEAYKYLATFPSIVALLEQEEKKLQDK